MRILERALAALLLLGLAAPSLARTLYFRIDPVHTQVLFSVDHDGYSKPVGRMRVKAGWLRFDEDDLSTAKVVVDVDAASVDLGDKQWNDAITDKRFLDAKDYPVAHFESTSVEKSADKGGVAGNGGKQGVLHGNLTLRGVTHEVAIQFTLNRTGATMFAGMQTLAGFSAHATLDRTQFGMTAFPKAVGAQVGLHFEVEAVLDQDAQKQYEAHASGKETGDAPAQH